MSYNVKNTTGETVAVVPDNYTNRESTSLALIGYNVTDYGLDHAQNFIALLENFAFEAPPENPMVGQAWFNTTDQTLRLYDGSEWIRAGGGGIGSIGDDITEGGIAGVWHLYIPDLDTSILLFFSGGVIVMTVATKDIPQNSLPPSVTISGTQYVLSSRFPYGLQAGATLAEDAADYLFAGRVVRARQADFAGGGNNNTPAGWAYADLGTETVGFMIANGQIVCAVAQTAIPAASLPINITLETQLDDSDGRATQTTTVPCRSLFSGGLFAGFTFGSGMSMNGFVTTALLAQLINDQVEARASIITEFKVWADSESAGASKMTTLEAKFKTAAGTTSFAQAVDYMLAKASDTTAVATAMTNLRTEFTNALGVSSWSQALSTLTATSSAASANTQSVTQLKAAFQNSTGTSNIGTAVQRLWTEATASTSSAAWGLSLNSNGYVTGIQAYNGGAQHNYFKVTASRFIIVDNNIEYTPFEVRDGKVYMKNAVIQDLTLDGEKFKPNAVSLAAEWATGTVRQTDEFGVFPNSYNQAILRTGRVPNGTKVLLMLTINLEGGDSDFIRFYIRRYKNDNFSTINKNVFPRVDMQCADTGANGQSWVWSDVVNDDAEYSYHIYKDTNDPLTINYGRAILMLFKK